MTPEELLSYGFTQYLLQGKGIVVNPISKPVKYLPESSHLLNDQDNFLISCYKPNYQIVLSEPIDKNNLKGLWKTGILTKIGVPINYSR